MKNTSNNAKLSVKDMQLLQEIDKARPSQLIMDFINDPQSKKKIINISFSSITPFVYNPKSNSLSTKMQQTPPSEEEKELLLEKYHTVQAVATEELKERNKHFTSPDLHLTIQALFTKKIRSFIFFCQQYIDVKSGDYQNIEILLKNINGAPKQDIQIFFSNLQTLYPHLAVLTSNVTTNELILSAYIKLMEEATQVFTFTNNANFRTKLKEYEIYKLTHDDSLEQYRLTHSTEYDQFKLIHDDSLEQFRLTHSTEYDQFKLIHDDSLEQFRLTHSDDDDEKGQLMHQSSNSQNNELAEGTKQLKPTIDFTRKVVLFLEKQLTKIQATPAK